MRAIRFVPFVIILLAALLFAGFYDIEKTGLERLIAATLIEEKPVAELVTAEYSIKLVFPHDFLPAGADIATYKRIMKKAAEKTPLTPEEEKNIRVYIRLDRIGRPFDKYPYDFFVTRLIVRSGYHGIPKEENIEEPVILDIRLQEYPSEKGWPDIRLSAEQYKEISQFILDNYSDKLPLERIKEEAALSAKEIIKSLEQK